MMKRLYFVVTVGVFLGGAISAQTPDTPSGRTFAAWLTAFNSADRVTIQQFLDASMPGRQVEQVLANRNMTGGFDLKRVEESSETRIVVLAQERGPRQQFVRITMNVSATAPYQVTGIQIQPATPPADLAPPKLSSSEAAAARASAPFLQFSAWLEVFNAGDRDRFRQFVETRFPSANVDGQMNFRERTGGFELRALEYATATTATGILQERNSDQFARFTVVVEAAEPHRITSLPITAIPRPTEFAITRMNETELIAASGTKLTRDAAGDRFAGSVLLARNGKVLFSSAYGLADRGKTIANTLDTRYRIGSMNKMFTAVAILQLVQAGKITLTDTVGKYITDYPNQEVARKVTVHQLLTHTGGTGDFFGPEFQANRLTLRTLNDYVARFGTRGPAFEPGSRWAYSNYGMLLLGVIVERVSGQSYYDYVSEHIYKVAAMSRSGSEPESELQGKVSVGYMRRPGSSGWQPNTDTLPFRGTSAGGGYSTVGDLMKFADALIAHRLLNADNTTLLITGKAEAGGGRMYAYGFEDSRKNGVGFVGHSGGAPGMNGDLRIYPQSGYVVAVLSNLDPPAAQQISEFIDARLPQ
jgi:D-alanyl-D-alanine carboxypeptidase